MPVTCQIIGTGMTERPSISISAPYGEKEMDAMRRLVEAHNQTCTFEGRVAPWELFCQNLFAKEKLPPWDKWVRIFADGRSWADDIPEDVHRYFQDIDRSGEYINTGLGLASSLYPVDSEVWFAGEILSNIDAVRRARASHNEESALCRAWDVGELIATASLKFRWEADALFGKDTREKRRKANAESRKTRGGRRQQQLHNVQSKAIALWRNDPTLKSSLTKTAGIIAKELNLNPHTVRGYLKKPDEWCPCESPKQKSDCT